MNIKIKCKKCNVITEFKNSDIENENTENEGGNYTTRGAEIDWEVDPEEIVKVTHLIHSGSVECPKCSNEIELSHEITDHNNSIEINGGTKIVWDGSGWVE